MRQKRGDQCICEGVIQKSQGLVNGIQGETADTAGKWSQSIEPDDIEE